MTKKMGICLLMLGSISVVLILIGNYFRHTEGEYSSEYIYVLNRENETELLVQNENVRAYPASLTKIMTVLVALEQIENLSSLAPIDPETYQEMILNNASMAGFKSNEQTTYLDLLFGTILRSGGEAANALAINVAGSTKKFVELMNKKGKELGLNDTHFANPEGLHDRNQYTTASDMGKLLDHALENPLFKSIFTQKEFRTSGTSDHFRGILLKSIVLSSLEGTSQDGFEIMGGKSGTTLEAGECWATLALKEGVEYICIVMGAPLKDLDNPSKNQITDTIQIYESIK